MFLYIMLYDVFG